MLPNSPVLHVDHILVPSSIFHEVKKVRYVFKYHASCCHPDNLEQYLDEFISSSHNGHITHIEIC